jgi:hypothetical protein
MGENREREIEDAVIADPGALGFPGAAAIRNVRVAMGFGRIDLMLIPRSGPAKLVLVEAKHSSAPDCISKVIGQLLMYYAGALRIGSTGFECFRKYADSQRERALSTSWISPKQLTGGVTPPSAAWGVIQTGEKLCSEDIRLFVAINSPPHEALRTAVRVLHQHHALDIGLLVVQERRIQLLSSDAA